MTTIDLRHLANSEVEKIIFTGEKDGKEYTLYMKKTVGMTLALQEYRDGFLKSRDVNNLSVAEKMTLNMLVVTAWIKGFYPSIDFDWVCDNLSEDVSMKLMTKASELFFPKTETEKP